MEPSGWWELSESGDGTAVKLVMTPKPGGLYSLAPVLSNETLVGREKLTDMQKRLSATATTVGINGDYFNVNDGRPNPTDF